MGEVKQSQTLTYGEGLQKHEITALRSHREALCKSRVAFPWEMMNSLNMSSRHRAAYFSCIRSLETNHEKT